MFLKTFFAFLLRVLFLITLNKTSLTVLLGKSRLLNSNHSKDPRLQLEVLWAGSTLGCYPANSSPGAPFWRPGREDSQSLVVMLVGRTNSPLTLSDTDSLRWTPKPLSASQEQFPEISVVRERLKDVPPPERLEKLPRATSSW